MRPQKLNRLLVVVAFGIAGSITFASWCGVKVNLSDSIARGLWLVSSRDVSVGEYVMVCPPNTALIATARARGYISSGRCPGDFAPLMKRVVAAAGDTVTIEEDGVRVNGAMLPHSAPRERDGSGRPLTAWNQRRFVVGQDDLLLYGDGTPSSFDGRYFGPVPRKLVQGVIDPLLVERFHHE